MSQKNDKMVFSEEIEEIKYEDYIFEKEYSVQRRDIDMNNHMHNLSHLDMAYEILPQVIFIKSKKIFDNVRIVYAQRNSI
ncbi:MAG: hypothetical protein ACLS28_00535 [Clostridium neonatale]